MSLAFKWTCKYCNRPTTITEVNYHAGWRPLAVEGYHQGSVGLRSKAIVCPNPDCMELTLDVEVTGSSINAYGNPADNGGTFFSFDVMPQSNVKSQPDYIPQEIRDNYAEACLLLKLSPKASATMSRRCLQGMVRDFWKLSKKELGMLAGELDAIKNRIPSDSWDAIDAIREVGNIGAHMEKDVNYVVDVEPDEAEALVRLIEMLFQDWYIAQHDRDERKKSVIALGAKKKKQIADARAASKQAAGASAASSAKPTKP